MLVNILPSPPAVMGKSRIGSQLGDHEGSRVARSRFDSDPYEGIETLCSGTLCLPYASGGRRQRWGFNRDSGWEDGMV